MSRCTYPRCACKATGVYCSQKPAPKAPKQSIARVSDKGAVKREAKKETVQGDMEFYFWIWKARKHECECCQKPLYMLDMRCFHHILPKRNYPEYRRCGWNIMILCTGCHNAWEDNPDARPMITTVYNQLLKQHSDGELKPCPF